MFQADRLPHNRSPRSESSPEPTRQVHVKCGTLRGLNNSLNMILLNPIGEKHTYIYIFDAPRAYLEGLAFRG